MMKKSITLTIILLLSCANTSRLWCDTPQKTDDAQQLNMNNQDNTQTRKFTPKPKAPNMEEVKTPSGLRYKTLIAGTGDSPKPGQLVTVHYTGWLDDGNGEAKGQPFDSSIKRGTRFTFTIGKGQVIAGWDQGVMSMKIGEKRRLYIPARLGYGAAGAGRAIPGNADLIFDVELFSVSDR